LQVVIPWLFLPVFRNLLSKKSTLKERMDDAASKAIHDLKIGDLSLGLEATLSD
jgi:hypothetical protein